MVKLFKPSSWFRNKELSPTNLRELVLAKHAPEDSPVKHQASLIPFELTAVERPGEISLTIFEPSWLTESGGEWRNPQSGKKEGIRVSEVITYEKNKAGDYKRVHVPRTEVSKYFGDACTELQVQESDSDWGRWGDAVGSSQSGKYLPFQPSPATRQMYVYDYWKMLAQAFTLFNYNPLARAGISYKSAFVVGTGPKITFVKGQEKLQEAWDAWSEEIKLTKRLETWCRQAFRDGNLYLEDYVNKKGKWVVRSIDAGTVYDHVTEPRDCDVVYGYVLMYQTKYQVFGTGAAGEQVPLSEWIYETIPPDNVFQLKFNCDENEIRGRSDLLPVLEICQWFMDCLKAMTLQEFAKACVAWDVTLKNAEQADIDRLQGDLKVTDPSPMSTFVHNDQVVREFMGGTSSQGRASMTFEQLVSAFCIGILEPKEYLAAGDSGTRATAITATEPSMKVFVRLRSDVETALRWVVGRFAKQNGAQITSKDFECIWPELVPENATEKIANLTVGFMNGLISKKRFAEGFAKEMDLRSYNFDDEMVQRDADDAAERLKNPLTGFMNGQPPPAGMGIPPQPGAPAKPGTAMPPIPAKPIEKPGGLSSQARGDIKDVGK